MTTDTEHIALWHLINEERERYEKLTTAAIGIELQEQYCEIAANRLRQGVFDFSEATE